MCYVVSGVGFFQWHEIKAAQLQANLDNHE